MSDRPEFAGDATDEVGIVPGLDAGEAGGAAPTAEPAPLAPADTPEPTATTPAVGHAAQQPFRVVFRGYDRREVDDRVAALTARVAELADAVQAARAGETAAVAELERGRPSFDALGQRVAEMLRLAEAEAEEMRARAAFEAAGVRDAAARDAVEIRRAAEEGVIALRQQWAAILAQMSAARDGLTTLLNASHVIDLTEGDTTAVRQATDD